MSVITVTIEAAFSLQELKDHGFAFPWSFPGDLRARVIPYDIYLLHHEDLRREDDGTYKYSARLKALVPTGGEG